MSEVLDLSHYAKPEAGGACGLDLAVEGVHCGACIARIESAMKKLPGVTEARLNFTNRRLHVAWAEGALKPAQILSTLEDIGYRGHPFGPLRAEEEEAAEARRLTRYLAVAGFAAMNVMLLSVSVWAGTDMTPETRDFFHWASALIALPAAAYAGQPFFKSAWRALRARSLNMDVPISVGVTLALAMSLWETANHAESAYFDSAIMLLFFLLVGRTLEHAMRRKTRAVAGNLAALKADTAHRFAGDELVSVPVKALAAGDRLLVKPGERVPADAIVIGGASELDESVITGETARRAVASGAQVYAGSMNYSGALTLRVTAAGWLIAGASVHDAIVTAIAVLIITCPCALALAIPAVQVVASGALFRAGIILNAGDAVERLAEADTVIFDKTGTLTLPEPRVLNAVDPDLLQMAARLALSSRHPLAVALSREAVSRKPFEGAVEEPGQGVRAVIAGVEAGLGSAEFCKTALQTGSEAGVSKIYFRYGAQSAAIAIAQKLRPDAAEVVEALRARGLDLRIVSGDRAEAVKPVAEALGITQWQGGLKPADKIARIDALKRQGRRVLMVGDGLNDAPSLAAAHVSLSPISAADLTQAHADAVFLGERLGPVRDALVIARRARALMKENLWFAASYNAVAVPVAIAGLVTPLIAALAMSASSITVTLNALRAARGVKESVRAA